MLSSILSPPTQYCQLLTADADGLIPCFWLVGWCKTMFGSWCLCSCGSLSLFLVFWHSHRLTILSSPPLPTPLSFSLFSKPYQTTLHVLLFLPFLIYTNHSNFKMFGSSKKLFLFCVSYFLKYKSMKPTSSTFYMKSGNSLSSSFLFFSFFSCFSSSFFFLLYSSLLLLPLLSLLLLFWAGLTIWAIGQLPRGIKTNRAPSSQSLATRTGGQCELRDSLRKTKTTGET